MLYLRTLFPIMALCSVCTLSVVYAQQATQTTETTTTATQTPAGPVVTKKVITTTVPAAKEVITAPTGYVSCDTIPAAWENNIWIPEHRVCKYANSPLGAAWIEGYWACAQYKLDTGECTNWNWIAAHWVKTYTGSVN